jgi:hypothetical protein
VDEHDVKTGDGEADIASGMDNECVMNLYDNELDGMTFWITYGHNGLIKLLYNSCLDD